MKIVQFSRPPTEKPPLPSPNDNQLIKRKHNLRMTVICHPYCHYYKSAFDFTINPLILPGFPLTSFYLVKASLLYLLLICAVVQKYQ